MAKGETDNSLRAIAALLREHPDAVASIMGHTDSQGSAQGNLKLSLRRAENIRFILSRDHGLSLGRLQATGYGETYPVADNVTWNGRAANRRIEVAVALPEQQKALRPMAASRATPQSIYAQYKASRKEIKLHNTTPQRSLHAGNGLQLPSTPSMPAPAQMHVAKSTSGETISHSTVTYTPLPSREVSRTRSSTNTAGSRKADVSRISGRYSPTASAPAGNMSSAVLARAPQGIEIVAVGDIMMGSTWRRNVLPPSDGAELFSHVTPYFQGADLVFGNLEGPLIDGGQGQKCRSGSRNCYEFRTPTRYVRHLQRAGFNAMSIANNHASDFGAQGQKSTIETLLTAGIQPVGGQAVGRLTVKGKRVAFIGFSHRGGAYSYPIQDLAGAQALVQKLARENDLVIVSFHGGAEGSGASHVPNRTEYCFGENRGNVRAFAHAVIDAGADMVLGHGPHVLRGMERYKDRLIAYSLGNFLTYELFSTSGLCGQSVVLRATLDPETGAFLHGKVTPVRLTRQGLPRPDTTQAATRQIMQLSRRITEQDGLQFSAGLQEGGLDHILE